MIAGEPDRIETNERWDSAASDKKTITAVDLFAGAGGFGLGFVMAGYKLSLAVEIDAWACDTLRYNPHGLKVIQGDITHLHWKSAIRALIPKKPDIIFGGPPCQGFSIAGPARKDPSDPRNSLFMNFVEWVGTLQPKVFVMENVKGLLARKNSSGESVIEIIKASFVAQGYHVEVWSLCAANYGVPQVRDRIFIVGHKGSKVIGSPPPTHSLLSSSIDMELCLDGTNSLQPVVTLWDAISDLPELGAGEGQEEQPYQASAKTPFQKLARKGSKVLYNHVAMSHSKRLVERFRHIGFGQSISDVPMEHGPQRRNGKGELSANGGYDQNNRRLFPHRPSHTIAASFYANFLHPFEHRNLTAREGARIQSFPDWYRFLGKKTVVSQKLLIREERNDEKFLCQYNQVGNAVPPLLAKAIATHLKRRLFNEN